MTVGLLLITHSRIGEAILETAGKMLEGAPLGVECLPVGTDGIPEKLIEQASMMITRLDQGHGVLVLTDMYGSTPSNIAYSLAQKGSGECDLGYQFADAYTRPQLSDHES